MSCAEIIFGLLLFGFSSTCYAKSKIDNMKVLFCEMKLLLVNFA